MVIKFANRLSVSPWSLLILNCIGSHLHDFLLPSLTACVLHLPHLFLPHHIHFFGSIQLHSFAGTSRPFVIEHLKALKSRSFLVQRPHASTFLPGLPCKACIGVRTRRNRFLRQPFHALKVQQKQDYASRTKLSQQPPNPSRIFIAVRDSDLRLGLASASSRELYSSTLRP